METRSATQIWGQLWPRQWLVAWRHHAVTWTNITYLQWPSVEFNWEKFNRMCCRIRSVTWMRKSYFSNYCYISHGQWVKTLSAAYLFSKHKCIIESLHLHLYLPCRFVSFTFGEEKKIAFHSVNILAADDQSLQGARTSTAMELVWLGLASWRRLLLGVFMCAHYTSWVADLIQTVILLVFV